MSATSASSRCSNDKRATMMATSVSRNISSGNAVQINGPVADKVCNLHFQNLIVSCQCISVTKLVTSAKAPATSSTPILEPPTSLSVKQVPSVVQVVDQPVTALLESASNKADFRQENLVFTSRLRKIRQVVRAIFRPDLPISFIDRRILNCRCNFVSICILIQANCRTIFNMVDPISLVSAIQASTQLMEQAFRILKRLRTAYERQKDVVDVLNRHETELSGVKTIIGIIEDEDGLRTPSIAMELGRLQVVQTKLAKLLHDLDPQGKGKVSQYTRQLIHGSEDERKLCVIMTELAHVKSTLLVCIQVANIREMGNRFEANAEAIQRIDQILRENCEGLQIARLLKGRRPSNDGYVPLTRAELKSLENDASNSECSEDETLVDESEEKQPNGIFKTERILSNNESHDESVQINGPVEKDLWKHISRLEIKDNHSKDKKYSVLLLGLDNAGKTTLLEQIKGTYTSANANLRTVPTVGQNVATIALPPPNPPIYLKIWDVGGQHSLRGLWQSYYSSCHAIVFVIDSSDVGNATLADLSASNAANNEDIGRLDECKLVLESVLANEEASGVPILILANKQDREDCVEVVRIKEGFVRRVFEGEKGGNMRDSRVLPCSALTGTGVQEAVEWLCSRMAFNKEARPPVMR
ncbi:hypothetical protein yc1106_07623 [Curvularia clavata]|uniref:Uncharacterized protein n=1 Tax=Curvularia clavata TaxID=95742 RepID=A0A9Q9DVZ4_CURCL|nr:hypothetical protein yc1106_07623 [Curvularia clavata]